MSDVSKKIQEILNDNNATIVNVMKIPETDISFQKKYPHADLTNSNFVARIKYHGKLAILKMITKENGSMSKLKRELFVYKNLRKQSKMWHDHLPVLYVYKQKPLPYLLIEDVGSEPLGVWFRISTKNVSDIKKAILAIQSLYKEKVRIPKKNILKNQNNFSFYLQKNIRIVKTLRAYDVLKRQNVWEKYKAYGLSVKNEWNLVKSTVISGDMVPSNIILSRDTVYFIDFQLLTIGKVPLEYAYFFHAVIGSSFQDEIYQFITQDICTPAERKLFDFLLIHRILLSLRCPDKKKNKSCLIFLSRLLRFSL